MDREMVAKELVALAKTLAFQEEAQEPTTLRRLDPKLNAVATKLVSATGGDLTTMLTVVIMALRKAGHSSDANKVFNMFRPFLRKIQKVTDL